jgi:hypothetical protein
MQPNATLHSTFWQVQLLRIVLFGLLAWSSLDAQIVSLRNVSYPGTALEVGNTVEVKITGAAPFASVTVVQNGDPPFFFGTTDGLGSWSTTAVEQQSNIGLYTQTWYVDGVAATPLNPSATYLASAPRLPSFSVYSNYVGINAPPISTIVNVCTGSSGISTKWIWSPVAYWSTSVFGNSVAQEAATRWNSTQSKLTLTNSFIGGDIEIYDATLSSNVYASTVKFNQSCNPGCYGYRNDCNGTCFNSSALYYADIQMNQAVITDAAPHLNTTPNAFAAAIIAHELGHTLGLSHPFLGVGRCSEVQAVMFPEGGLMFACGKTSPTGVDLGAFNGLYSSFVPFCSIGGSYCVSTTC